ncbi:MAG: tRNA (adenosine(37)-N6)-threonylcarbamoyltransferase complex ATPase subunit type 1 TsaE [Sphingobacteriaceae bacterium]
MTLSVAQLAELPAAAQKILEYAGKHKIFLFHGEMGAGKTTFIKAFCAALGVNNGVSSPTFALVNEYEYPEGLIYHFDCYRLKSASEALDIGFEEYLASGQYCFIEWPEKVEPLWPHQYLSVTIQAHGPDTRTIQVEQVG